MNEPRAMAKRLCLDPTAGASSVSAGASSCSAGASSCSTGASSGSAGAAGASTSSDSDSTSASERNTIVIVITRHFTAQLYIFYFTNDLEHMQNTLLEGCGHGKIKIIYSTSLHY